MKTTNPNSELAPFARASPELAPGELAKLRKLAP